MIVNDIGLTKDSYSHIYTADGNEIGTVYDREGHVIYYMYRDTIGDGSRVFTSYGAPIKDYKIYGNTFQDGTPSSDYPVDVVGCGVRTENLLEITDDIKTSTSWELGPFWFDHYYFIYYNITNVVPRGIISANIFENFEPGYKPNLLVCAITPDVMPTVSQEYRILTNNGVVTPKTFDTTSWDNVYLCIGYGNGFDAESIKQQKIDELFNNWRITIIEDSTPPDHYFSHCYKLPETITNGIDTVTTPIYIGSEPIHRIGNYADYAHYSIDKIVRRIRTISLITGSYTIFQYFSDRITIPVGRGGILSGATVISNYALPATSYGNVVLVLWNIPRLAGVITGDSETVAKQKCYEYFKQFEDSGTPATFWYVMAEPVEEDPPVPFPELPTLTGTNTLTVDTPVKPSEIDITGRLKTSGYGKLLDKNLIAINDSTGTPIFIRG